MAQKTGIWTSSSRRTIFSGRMSETPGLNFPTLYNTKRYYLSLPLMMSCGTGQNTRGNPEFPRSIPSKFPRPLLLAPHRKARRINESVGEAVCQPGLHRSLSSGCYCRSYRDTTTNCGMRAGITWRLTGMIPAPFRIIWGIRTFSILCAIHRGTHNIRTEFIDNVLHA
jgi:hypothetical protein